jgi:hypothetical protein
MMAKVNKRKDKNKVQENAKDNYISGDGPVRLNLGGVHMNKLTIIQIVVTVFLTVVITTLLMPDYSRMKAQAQEIANESVIPSNSSSSNIPPAPTSIPERAKNQTSCDPNLEKNIANNGPARFKIINPCVTIFGRITLVHTPSDGDTVFAVKLDNAFKSPSMVTKANFNGKMKGGIWIEEICQRKNTSREPIHQGDCKFPQYIKVFPYKAHVGDKVLVTGVFLQDIREGGHTEIHPVTSIKRIG